MKKFTILFVMTLLFSIPASARTNDKPARAVTDPGVVTTRQTITPAGVQTVFDGRVYGVAFGGSPNEIWALTARGRSSPTQVFKLDWVNNKILSRLPIAENPGLQGIVFDPVAKQPLISGTLSGAAAKDPKGKTRLLTVGDEASKIIADELGNFIAGAIAVAPKSNALGQRLAVVPLIYNNQLAVVDLNTGKLTGKADTGIAPFGAVINSEGTIAYVSNWGGRLPKPGELTAPTGYDPKADQVVVDERGIASTGTVTRVDLATMKSMRAIQVELHPTAMAWDEKGNRLYVANSNKDSISVIDTATDKVIQTRALSGQDTRGFAPTALALTADGKTLFAACGGLNAVAVIQTKDMVVAGYIPTGWYPNVLSLSPDGKLLAIGTLLGAGSSWREEPRKRYVHAYRGSIAVAPVPDEAQLASYTTAVWENNHLTKFVPLRSAKNNAKPSPAAIPARAGDPSLIEHVVYIIKENRTYDQVFGDMSKGNGDPSLVMFGEDVTPNQHRLADQFVLLDNFYATGGNSGDGHQWVTQANETSYALWPGYAGRSYPFDGSDPIAYSDSGFIWDAALKMKKTVRVYGEYAGRMTGG